MVPLVQSGVTAARCIETEPTPPDPISRVVANGRKRKRGSKYTEDERAAAVGVVARHSGKSLRALGKLTGIPHVTLGSWPEVRRMLGLDQGSPRRGSLDRTEDGVRVEAFDESGPNVEWDY